jgi:hypothetical protein
MTPSAFVHAIHAHSVGGGRGEIAVKGPTLMLGYPGVPLAETSDDCLMEIWSNSTKDLENSLRIISDRSSPSPNRRRIHRQGLFPLGGQAL